jgi:hypothetical protein
MPVAGIFTPPGLVYLPGLWFFIGTVGQGGGGPPGRALPSAILINKREIKLIAIVVTKVGEQREPIPKGKISIQIGQV